MAGRMGPRSYGTTMIFNAGDNSFKSVRDPAGGVVSYAWDTGQLASVTDGRGNRTTYMYVPLTTTGVRVLQSATTPLGNRFTFAWDTSGGRVRALVDPLARRTTLLWDANGNRIGLINALGFRNTWIY